MIKIPLPNWFRTAMIKFWLFVAIVIALSLVGLIVDAAGVKDLFVGVLIGIIAMTIVDKTVQ